MNDAKTKLTPIEKEILLKGSNDPEVLKKYEALKAELRSAELDFNAENRQFHLRRIYSSEKKNHKKDVKLRKTFEETFHEKVPPMPATNSGPSGSHRGKSHKE